MSNKPLVTIVIPLYNAEKYIGETIESVFNQSYQNWEIIVIDNCSTDNSKKIVKKFESKEQRLTLIELTYNSGGPARPRNIGIENTKGEYIAFLDADDVWLPKKLEKQIEFMKSENLNFSSCDCILIDENSSLYILNKISLFFNKMINKNNLCDLIKNNFILTSSVLIHKDLLLTFSEDTNLIAVEDFDLWLRIFTQHENLYKYQNEQLIKYRVLENSASKRSSFLSQELKANIVLSNFLLNNTQYIWCYYYRLFFHLFKNHMKILIKNLWS